MDDGPDCFEPEIGHNYWYVKSTGRVKKVEFKSSKVDWKRLQFRNCFRCKSEAEDAAEACWDAHSDIHAELEEQEKSNITTKSEPPINEGWIPHRGKKRPVSGDTVVDIFMAYYPYPLELKIEAWMLNWGQHTDGSTITHYRPTK